MNDCDAIRDLIGPYTDGDLPSEARSRVERHLLICRQCAWEAQSLRITREILRDDDAPVVASDALRARLLRRLYADNPHCARPETADADATQYRLPIPLEN